MAIHFLYDEVLEKNEIELEGILKELKKDPDVNKKTFILNSFARSLIEASKKIKEKQEVKLKPSLMEIKQKLIPVKPKPLPAPGPSIIQPPKPTVITTPKPYNIIIKRQPIFTKESQIIKQEQLEYKTPTLIPKTEIEEEKQEVEIKKIKIEEPKEAIKKIPLIVDKDNN